MWVLGNPPALRASRPDLITAMKVNAPVDASMAGFLAEPGKFVEAILAPSFDDDAREILTTRPKWKNNVRLLSCAVMTQPQPAALEIELHDHPWRLHAWQVPGDYFTMEPLEPGGWSGHVTNVVNQEDQLEDQTWNQLWLWRAPSGVHSERLIPPANRFGN